MRTSADEKRDSVLKHLNSAIQDLNVILVDECWGYEDYTPKYQKQLEKSFNKLLKIKRVIDPRN